MSASELISASKLVPLPETLFPRHENSEEHIADLAEALRSGAKLPPILIDGQSRIVDGFHRWKAHIAAFGPEAPVPCQTKRYGSDKDLFLDALRENAKHGLRFNRSDRARCSAIAARLDLDAADLAPCLSTTPEGLIRAAGEALPGEGEGSLGTEAKTHPEKRAKDYAERLLKLLGAGHLKQNRVALEKDLNRLLTAIDGFLSRGQTTEDWEETA